MYISPRLKTNNHPKPEETAMKHRINTTTLSRKREQLLAAGAYDGRYRTKMVPNKKKEEQTKRTKNINRFFQD